MTSIPVPATRWGSTQAMIARILEQQKALCAVLAEDRKYWHCMPSDCEFSTLEAVSSVLQPLYTFTDALSGEKNVTVLAIRPLLKHILEELLASTDAECALVKEMRETIADDLQARYINGGISELIDMCTFLDPRFRTRYLENEKETLAKVERESSEIVEVIHRSSQCQQVAPPPPKKKKKVRGHSGKGG